MARLYNRVQGMEEERLPKVILNWDFVSGSKGWLADMTNVTTKVGLDAPDMDVLQYDLDNLKTWLHEVSRLE